MAHSNKCEASKGVTPHTDTVKSGHIYRFGSKTEGNPQEAARQCKSGEWWMRESVFQQINQATGGALCGSPESDVWDAERAVRKHLAILPCWNDLAFVVKAEVMAQINIYSGPGVEVSDIDRKTGRPQKIKPYPNIEQIYIPAGEGNERKLQIVDVRVLAGHA